MGEVFAKLIKIVPPILLIVALVAIWWGVIATKDSPIFPTPWQVVTGAWELAKDGTLLEHIEASLLRVGIGFGWRFSLRSRWAFGWVGSRARITR